MLELDKNIETWKRRTSKRRKGRTNGVTLRELTFYIIGISTCQQTQYRIDLNTIHSQSLSLFLSSEIIDTSLQLFFKFETTNRYFVCGNEVCGRTLSPSPSLFLSLPPEDMVINTHSFLKIDFLLIFCYIPIKTRLRST